MSQLPPLKTWQVYQACRKILGMETLQKLFKRSPTQIYRWGRDPDVCDDVERNPLDRTIYLLERLQEVGRDDIARSAVAMMAESVGCELVCSGGAVPDKDTIEAECLDDYPALTKFHQAIQGRSSPEIIRHLWQSAKRELDETWEMYANGK